METRSSAGWLSSGLWESFAGARPGVPQPGGQEGDVQLTLEVAVVVQVAVHEAVVGLRDSLGQNGAIRPCSLPGLAATSPPPTPPGSPQPGQQGASGATWLREELNPLLSPSPVPRRRRSATAGSGEGRGGPRVDLGKEPEEQRRSLRPDGHRGHGRALSVPILQVMLQPQPTASPQAREPQTSLLPLKQTAHPKLLQFIGQQLSRKGLQTVQL